MYDVYNDLEDLCETISREIKDANEKIRKSGGKISPGDVEYVDKLTHTLKSIKTTMAMMDVEEDGSFSDGSYGSYSTNGMYRNNDTMRRSYARGRGRNSKRDSMGRYASRMSRNGSYDDGFISELHDLMEDAPNDSVKQELRKIVERVENQM